MASAVSGRFFMPDCLSEVLRDGLYCGAVGLYLSGCSHAVIAVIVARCIGMCIARYGDKGSQVV